MMTQSLSELSLLVAVPFLFIQRNPSLQGKMGKFQLRLKVQVNQEDKCPILKFLPIIKETAQKEDSNVEEVKIEENSNKKENITEEVLKEEVTPKKEISHIPFLEDAKNSLKPIKEVTLPVESPVKVINNKLGNIQIEGELVKGYLEYNMYNVPLDIFTYAFVRPHNSILHHTATVFYEGSQFTPKELSLMKKSTKYDSYMINKYSDIYKDLHR